MDYLTFAGITLLAVSVITISWLAPHKIIVSETGVGLLYKNGLLTRVLKPGAYWIWRIGTTWTFIDTRLRVSTVPGQDVLTLDNVGLKVSLAVRFSVVDAAAAMHRVDDYTASLYYLAQIALRTAIGSVSVDELLARRGELSTSILESVRSDAEEFGLKVEAAEVKDFMFPADLKRNFAEVIRAKKEGEAALEKARGESAALRNLANAAKLLEKNPMLLRLRALGSIDAAGRTVGNTLILGMPKEILSVAASEEKA